MRSTPVELELQPKLPVTSGRQVGYGQISLGIAVGLLAIGAAVLLARHTHRLARSAPQTMKHDLTRGQAAAAGSETKEANLLGSRRLNRAAGVLAFSVLADSAVEHYRGSFANRAMYTPLLVSSMALAVSAHGVVDHRHSMGRIRHATYIASALAGFAGGGFHLYNVSKRPGRFAWQNLFYAAPLGAPYALLLSGVLGAVAERVRAAGPPRLFGDAPAGRVIAGLVAIGLVGTTAEVALLHFRGAFHDPFMFAPVTVPPIAAALLARIALNGGAKNHGLARWWLRLTAAMGLAGAGFHAYGVQRNMGGWRNWTQNVLNGPPIPAPPSFTGLALAGLAGLALTEGRPDA